MTVESAGATNTDVMSTANNPPISADKNRRVLEE